MAILNSLNKINDFLDTSSAGKFLGGSKVLPQVGATLFNAAINPNGNSTGIGNTIQSVSSFIPGIGGAIGQVAGGLINTTFGSNINEEFVDRTNNSIDTLNSFYSTATDSTSLMNDWGNAGFMSHVNKDDVGSEGIFSNKASNLAKTLNSKIDLANKRAYMGLFNTAANISKNNALSALASSYALGGQLSNNELYPYNFTTRRRVSYVTNMKKNYEDGGYINPTTKGGVLAKAALQIADPTGISSYPDLFNSGVQFYNDPSLKNFGDLGLNFVSALPLIGKVSAPFKIAKTAKLLSKARGLNTAQKSIKTASNVNKKIDTFSELIPGVRPIAEKVQDVTTNLISDPLFNKLASKNKYSRVKDYRNSNIMIDLLNTVNTGADFYQGGRDFNKKAFGGNLLDYDITQDNEFTIIGNGGTHESNPYEGVQMGVDSSGIPNLVEEGEVIWNDYVFSNRLKVPNKVKKKYGLKDNSTFAEAIKKFTKESEELPHDPITRRGMNAIASELAGVQEGERVKKNNSNVGNMFEEGGFTKEVDPLGLLGQTVSFYPASATDLLNAKRYSSTPVTMKTLNPKLPDPIKQDPLRYVPIAASSAAVLNDFLGGNKPDYSNLSTYENAIKRSYRPVAARRVNSYLTYKPFDVERPINALNASTAASRRAILDNSGGNRATALTGLFALDRGYNNSIGDLYDKAFATNLANKAKVEEYNRATDTYNNDQATKADMFNTELLGKQASMYGQLASAKQRILEANRLERMNNLTNFITNLSNLGRENIDRDTLRWLAEIGALPYDARGRFKGGA